MFNYRLQRIFPNNKGGRYRSSKGYPTSVTSNFNAKPKGRWVIPTSGFWFCSFLYDRRANIWVARATAP
jgi:hypothetical protein